MRYRDWQPSKDRLLARYNAMMEAYVSKRSEPLLWHGALRQLAWAMSELARHAVARGMTVNPFSGAGLARRAYRLGDPTGAYNAALDSFNRANLSGYRHWLRRAARAGDTEAAEQLRRFEIRLPHANAPRGYRRPYRRGE